MGKAPKRSKAREESKRRFPANIYHDHYKVLLIVPLIIFFAAVAVLASNYVMTGQPIALGVSLSGGITITVPVDEPIEPGVVESRLRSDVPNDVMVRSIAELGRQTAISVQAAPTTPDEDLQVLEESLLSSLEEEFPNIRDSYTIEIIGPSLGASFLWQTLLALLFAFLFMAAVVFYYFRTLVPSGAVVMAALADIVVTFAVVSMLDFSLSTAAIAAFLMLIGYSVDTDILLSTRVLRNKEGSVYERVINALKTGLIMQVTTLVAISIALFISQSEVIGQIMTVLFVGLIVDVIFTWIFNAGILRWYAEGREV